MLVNFQELVEALYIDMQSIFRLPWSSDPIAHEVSEGVALEEMRARPVAEIAALNKLDRSRNNSTDTVPTLNAPQSIKQRLESAYSLVSHSNIDDGKQQEPVYAYTRNRYRTHPLYSEGPKSDGLYHCPYTNEEPLCQHEPTKLKCNYE